MTVLLRRRVLARHQAAAILSRAERRGLPLATRDANLARAARAAGVSLG